MRSLSVSWPLTRLVWLSFNDDLRSLFYVVWHHNSYSWLFYLFNYLLRLNLLFLFLIINFLLSSKRLLLNIDGKLSRDGVNEVPVSLIDELWLVEFEYGCNHVLYVFLRGSEDLPPRQPLLGLRIGREGVV